MYWAKCYETFTSVIYEYLQEAKVFVTGKPVHPSPMFVRKGGAYPSGTPKRRSSLG